MKATLYKLKEGYVLCSDEGSKKGELTIFPNTENEVISNLDGCVPKIAEHDYGSNGVYNLKVLSQSPDFSELSEEDCKNIGWFDVKTLAREYLKMKNDTTFNTSWEYVTVGIYNAGFQKHAELTAERRFTEEDMYEAISMAQEFTQGHGHDYSASEIMEKLFQPKSWSVEYKEENGVYKVLSVS